MIHHGKYRIMAFKDFVPDKLRFIILIMTVLSFQFSSAVYLTNINEIAGVKSLCMEDLKFMLDASLIGMTLAFPLLFRIKFRFTSRQILLGCASMVIIGCLINIYSTNIMTLIITSLFIGFFKMVGTFECFSSVQLVITPKRDFAVFYPFLYLIVVGVIEFIGVITGQISYMFEWQYMHLAIIGYQLLIMGLIFFLMRPFRFMKKIPLYQIDWLGMALWAISFLLIDYLCEYGKRLDWFKSEYICLAAIGGLIALYSAICRMYKIRRPFIMPEAFKYKRLIKAVFLFALMQIFLSTYYEIMNEYASRILHYDILHHSSLDWASFIGVAIGVILSYYWLARVRGGYKAIFFAGFLCFVLFHFILYFEIAPSLAKDALYLPYALRGAGYASLYISLTLYISEGMPFEHFFAGLTIIGVVRSAIGGMMANSLISNMVERLQKSNLINLSQGVDFNNPVSNSLYHGVFGNSILGGQSVEQAKSSAISAIYNEVNTQALLLTWKEIFGWITMFGFIVLFGILFSRYIKNSFSQFPKIKNIRKYIWGKAYSGN